VGGAFTLFSGNVSGVIQELVRSHVELDETLYASRIIPWLSRVQTPYERIAQTWRFNTWTDGHFSDVVITISPKGSETSLRLVQTNVPVHDAERTRSGWHDLYFQRMKMILGFGSGISLGF
jgi:activator of HSP90 ATPase